MVKVLLIVLVIILNGLQMKVATGSDICDAENFFHTLKELSKVHLYLVTDNDIEHVEKTVPKNLIPLQDTMQVHHVFTDTPGGLKYRVLSCSCQKEFCLCLDPKTYRPAPTPVFGTIGNFTEKSYVDGFNQKEVLTGICNAAAKPKRSIVYSPSSSSDEEVLANLFSHLFLT
ncbi:unnamed protein product [Acanthoscelides obtectus]|uniref:Uncharacterized protein n=1 Tax=Acanthoscelides obtectus TaxID=200917 RepID=A0A9P0MA69_ACAOB|nr:unnamed protein product [Acanthoscelides obtectus]CAK1641972.1 hypothetical protein AOBTE_LOCUS12770 [Acanthoscelides obtectus]